MTRKINQYVVDERGRKVAVIIPLEEYRQLKHKPKVDPGKRKVEFDSGHLGDVHGELSREDIYCDR